MGRWTSFRVPQVKTIFLDPYRSAHQPRVHGLQEAHLRPGLALSTSGSVLKWQARPLRADEVSQAASLQALAFHEKQPIGFLNDLAMYTFKVSPLVHFSTCGIPGHLLRIFLLAFGESRQGPSSMQCESLQSDVFL